MRTKDIKTTLEAKLDECLDSRVNIDSLYLGMRNGLGMREAQQSQSMGLQMFSSAI